MTREKYLTELQTSYDASVKFGGNRAIKNHLEKVKGQTEEEFKAHYAALQARLNSPAVQTDIRRMAREFAARHGGSRA